MRVNLSQLRSASGPGPVLILTHSNPDPDALASGKALGIILESWGVSSHLAYSGLVARAENRRMLELLTPEWQQVEIPTLLDNYSAVALVDTQPGAGNNNLPVGYIPQIVIDHHNPIRVGLDKVPHADVQPDVGASVTLLYPYLAEAGVNPDPILATAMFYGLKTDTRGLSRGASDLDKSVYIELLSHIDYKKLTQVEQAGLPQAYFDAFNRGLQAAIIYGQSVFTNLGNMHRPDLAAEMADMLIRLESARAVLCIGHHAQTLHLSLRTKHLDQDAGLLIQEIIIPPGKAGGHGNMAGGQFPAKLEDVNAVVPKIKQRYLAAFGESYQGSPLLTDQNPGLS